MYITCGHVNAEESSGLGFVSYFCSFCKGKIMLLYSQFYTENHVFSLRINTCFWGFAGVFMGERNLFFLWMSDCSFF